jgi:hypothetical protein
MAEHETSLIFTKEEERKNKFKEHWEQLPEEIKKLMPEGSLEYYLKTNEMHCNLEKEGGSKFLPKSEGGVDDIIEVIEKMGFEKLLEKIKEQHDDREELIKVGAPVNAFLPGKKEEGMPTDLPEALYFKVDGIKGQLGIIQLQELSPETRVKVKQEKPGAPLSFLAIIDKEKELPQTDFATIIVGRDPGSNWEIWTIHPGAPIRPATTEGFNDGDEVKVSDLLKAGLKPEDYIKLTSEAKI